MKYTTGLPTAKFADLLIRLREEGVEPALADVDLRPCAAPNEGGYAP